MLSGSGSSGLSGSQFAFFSLRSDEPGSTMSTPLLPDSVGTPIGGTVPVFTFDLVPSGSWVDPPIVEGFEYAITNPGELFTKVGMPTGSAFANLTIETGGITYGPYDNSSASQYFTFPGGGVSAFKILGINPLLDPTDPNFSNAFPTYLEFNVPSASFTMTPLTIPSSSPIPEPGTFGLALAALVAIGGIRRRLSMRHHHVRASFRPA